MINDINDTNLNKIFSFKIWPTIERYYSEDSTWGVYVFKTNDEIPGTINQFDYDEENNIMSNVHFSSLIGKMQKLVLNTEYSIKAKFIHNKKFGYQYETIMVEQKVPKTPEDQSVFLQSISTTNQAKVLLDIYPNIVEDVIAGTDNVNLNLTKGIKEFTWNGIKQKILENYILSDLLVMLIPLGISYSKIKRLLNGEPNPQILKQRLLDDPYIISELDNISFKQADQIAIKINPDFLISKTRTIAFLKSHLQKIGNDEGHTWVNFDVLEHAILENIIECKDLYNEIIEEQKEFSTFLYIENDKVGLKYYHDIELNIFEIINKLANSRPLEISQENIDRGIEKSEKDQQFKFTEEQIQVLNNITKSNFNVLVGAAGTGKSSLARGILNIYRQAGYMIGCAALSAKAAKRIIETTGQNATTIHRLLGAKNFTEFEYSKDNRLPQEVLFLDEVSMDNIYILNKFLSAVDNNAKVILCGDIKQLPPINAGNPFKDIIDHKEFQINELTIIMRQALKSGIVVDATKIRSGENPINKYSYKEVHGENEDLIYMFRDNAEELNSIAIKSYLKAVEQDGIDNVVLLVPRKNNCTNCTKRMNAAIQDLILPDEKCFIEYGKNKYKKGAKIIHRVNNAEKGVYNGDIGFITDIINDVTYINYQGNIIEYEKEELKEIDLAYAMTVHLAQGSEYDTSVIVLDTSHFMLLSNQFLYTALTRAKKRALLLSMPYAFKKSLDEDKSTRNTWMKYFE